MLLTTPGTPCTPQEDWTSIYSNHIEPAWNMMEKHLYPQLVNTDAHVENMGRTASRMFYDVRTRTLTLTSADGDARAQGVDAR